jgi:hypothetical protein
LRRFFRSEEELIEEMSDRNSKILKRKNFDLNEEQEQKGDSHQELLRHENILKEYESQTPKIVQDYIRER